MATPDHDDPTLRARRRKLEGESPLRWANLRSWRPVCIHMASHSWVWFGADTHLNSGATQNSLRRPAGRNQRAHLHHQARFERPQPADRRPAGSDKATTSQGRPRGRAQQECRFHAAGQTDRRIRQLQGRTGGENKEYPGLEIEDGQRASILTPVAMARYADSDAIFYTVHF